MSAPSSSSIPATDNREKSSSPEELYSLGQKIFDRLFVLEFLEKAAAHDEEERLYPSPAFQPPEELCKEVVETQAKSKFVLFSSPSLKVPRYPLHPFSYELHVCASNQSAPFFFSPRPFPLCLKKGLRLEYKTYMLTVAFIVQVGQKVWYTPDSGWHWYLYVVIKEIERPKKVSSSSSYLFI